MLAITLVSMWLHYASALTQDWLISRPAYELIVHRRDTLDSAHRRCTHLALRQTQLFKSLPDEGYLKNKRLRSGEEHTQFIALEESQVWMLAESLCGKRNTWSGFQALIQQDLRGATMSESEQSVLRLGSRNALPLNVAPLITSGDSANRVDLMFFADGYTLEEESKFYEDALRLAEGITAPNQSFHTVKPLLNFWAAFTPSKESGVGVGGVPKDTAFGLYRDGTELRGVYYSKPEVARGACFSLGDRCDFPILMGNDPLYGGMDSEFTTITPSLANGPLVLRHELGHNIIDIGEEYDGGSADIYHGVNSAQNISLDTLPWAHWLTDPSRGSQGHAHTTHDHGSPPQLPRVERAVMPLQDYAWTMLNTSRAWSTTFLSSGTYARHLVRFSLSGLPMADDLAIELDGRDLHWEPHVDIGVDRWHYDIAIDQPLAGGEHEVTFKLRNKEREGEAQLCSVEVLEFGDETEFVSTPGHYGLYPTFSEKNETTYRPTHEGCLMRIVTTPKFCKPCLEELWRVLLRRSSLVDSLTPGCSRAGERTLDLSPIPLGQFRSEPVGVDEGYEITWEKDGIEVEGFKNKTTLVDDGDAIGSYAVKVRYWTEEVRVDKDGLLEGEAVYVVTTGCSR